MILGLLSPARPILWLGLGFLVAFTSSARAQEAESQSSMTPEKLWDLGRLSGGSLSPDGEWVLYSVRRYDVGENKGDSNLYVARLDGGQTIELTNESTSESGAQWVQTREGPRVFFLAKRGDQETNQLWSVNPVTQEATVMSQWDKSVSNLKVSPTGKHVAVTLDVKMGTTVQDLYEDLPKANARIIDSLLYRHWNEWDDFHRSHLHVAPVSEDGKAGALVDIMAGLDADCPHPPFGGASDFAWSPDGQEIAFVTKITNRPERSTDTDLYLVSMDNPEQRLIITAGMNGYDLDPVYSPDGKSIAFHSMMNPGFESDRNRIILHLRENSAKRELTRGLDQTTHDVTWAPDGSGVYFRSETRGSDQLYFLTANNPQHTQITSGRFNYSLRDISSDGQTLLVARQSMLRPWELGVMKKGSQDWSPLTHVNDEVYEDLALPTIEERWVEATDGKSIHNWVIYPPNFDPNKKWPMLTYCQGGPQGQIGQWFSYRWNFHLMAAQGYVVLAVNRRGLPGFGREWNDQISGDWGGQAMQDILAATDDMFTESYIDRDHTAAIGASFGGYTVYWMMGQHEDRFCSMIAHCGLFNLESFYGSTEELFFANWDLGGPYWSSPELQREYDRFSPHRFVGNWNTPLLVIHGEKDFRVPLNQGMEAFTAAQLQGVPSRFLYYPEEGHWVQGPQNSILWHRVFFEWLDRFCKE